MAATCMPAWMSTAVLPSNAMASMAMPLTGFLRGRHWVRTSELFGVKHARWPADFPVIVTQWVTQHFVPNSAQSPLLAFSRWPGRIWMKPNVLDGAIVAVLRCCTDLLIRRSGPGLSHSP